ncbi:MAG: hypothetical protein HOV83_37865 [Catenulispora sp.]|nr:hypothetical protein [Catenulispora sp.]
MIRPFRRRHRRHHDEIHPPPSLSLVERTAGRPAPNLATVSPAAGPPAQDADPRQLDKQFLAMLIAFAEADRIREAPPADPDGVIPA